MTHTKVDGTADTPGSVLTGRYRHRERRPSIYKRRCRRPPAAYPGTRAGSPRTCPVWPCSGWGLPSLPGHPGSWWSLTPPFHPYPPHPAQTQGVRAVCFLWHWPAGYPEWVLPTTLPCGARTFLEPRFVARGRLAIPSTTILGGPETTPAHAVLPFFHR